MDRAVLEDHLTHAERHVVQGECHVRRQRELIEHLASNGHDTTQARSLLVELERMLALHVADRDRIQSDLIRSAG